MSSTEKKNHRLNIALACVIMGATCVSSLTYTSEAKAQEEVVEVEVMAADPTVVVALVAGGLAAYGWLADKVYDLGKEVGKWAAGSTEVSQEALFVDSEFLLN